MFYTQLCLHSQLFASVYYMISKFSVNYFFTFYDLSKILTISSLDPIIYIFISLYPTRQNSQLFISSVHYTILKFLSTYFQYLNFPSTISSTKISLS